MNVGKDRMYALHEMVATVLEERLSAEEVDAKSLELAMRFLKDNNVHTDMTGSKLNTKLAVIPRLSDDELRLA